MIFWLEGTNGEDGTVNADTLHNDDDTIGALSRQTLSERDYWQLVSSMNKHQRVPFARVVRYTRELHQYNVKVHDDCPEAFHLFVTGGAGTGKSLGQSRNTWSAVFQIAGELCPIRDIKQNGHPSASTPI